MQKRIFVLAAAAVIGLAACDKAQEPPAAGATKAAEPPGAQSAQAPAFSSKLLDAPILGFYEPDYPYTIRSHITPAAEETGKLVTVTLEFWGASTDQVNSSVMGKMTDMGYAISKSNAERGYYTATFSAEGREDVLVNISPKGSRKMFAPGAVGTIYFQWKQ